MNNSIQKIKPEISPMYPTSDSLDIAYADIKSRLPIENSIQLKAALMLYQNTLLKELKNETHN